MVDVQCWAWVIFDSNLTSQGPNTRFHTGRWSFGHLLPGRTHQDCLLLFCFAEWLQASNQNLTWQPGDLSSPVLFHISSCCWHTSKEERTRGRKRPLVSERLLLEPFVKTRGCFNQPLYGKKTTTTHKGRKDGEQRMEANSGCTIAAGWPWVFIFIPAVWQVPFNSHDRIQLGLIFFGF